MSPFMNRFKRPRSNRSTADGHGTEQTEGERTRTTEGSGPSQSSSSGMTANLTRPFDPLAYLSPGGYDPNGSQGNSNGRASDPSSRVDYEHSHHSPRILRQQDQYRQLTSRSDYDHSSNLRALRQQDYPHQPTSQSGYDHPGSGSRADRQQFSDDHSSREVTEEQARRHLEEAYAQHIRIHGGEEASGDTAAPPYKTDPRTGERRL
ncbi:uncharacterized protein I206_107374 [Kwoniella pini CBS 10737]|uniref:Uncharacterized protein n=1 Tax=Kwoniella pini CBS 10737 TaxID=1296096 RepID=A0A1B9HX45_9TREE|nr:uncharacterized protein I206_05699 [Kwoniella pini CBS 10737]OCF47839.1 hypothetical protein I206_05699 [Kwoniella pini CBS 10737]